MALPMILLLLLGAVGLVFAASRVGRRDPRMPPGPPTLPLIGNLHQLPLTGIEEKFREWAKQYNGLFSLKLGNANMVVIADKKAVHELLDKKGNIYSDRPNDYILNFVDVDKHITFSPMGPDWRMKRKTIAHNFSPRMLDEKHFQVQEAEANWLMGALLERPDNIFNEIRRYTASVASSIIFGFRAPTFDSFWAQSAYRTVEQRSEALEPGANPPLDQFPFLKYVPASLAHWKRRAIAAREIMHVTWREARRRVDKRRQSGIYRDCLADSMLDNYAKEGWPMSEQEFNLLMGELMEGGADTTASQLLTLALAFTLYPEVQRKARAEIDAVCGDSRPPLWSDFDRLPYINAIVKEGMRWRPTAVVPLPHKIREDDYYEGMLIPKGSTIILGMTALHWNQELYPDADTFNPDRFAGYTKLANDYAGSGDWEKRDHYGYGAGRRICPGVHFAERSMWRVAAKLLWAFEFSPAKDPVTGEDIVLDSHAYTPGMLVSPLPYRLTVKVRSTAHLQTIKKELGAAMDYLRQFE